MSWIRTDAALSPAAGPSGYGPADLQSAYNLPSSTNGSGQTVAIVDAYDDPNAEPDLAIYRSTFALPPCTTANGCFLKVNESGVAGSYPATNTGWATEISLDVDMVSAVCPNCNILLVEANSNSGSDLYSAEDTAATTCGATEISNSWNGSEYSGEQFNESYFNHPGVPITFASGDSGYPGGYPTSSAYVTAVGGTHLTHSGSSWSETVWSGTGSLCSQYITQPSWQSSLAVVLASPTVCTMRIDNDVAAVADPSTGLAIYDTFGHGGWLTVGGTSAATPIIAGVYALAGNGSSINDGSYSYLHGGGLRDVLSGSNSPCPAPYSGTYICTAGAGFDGPTGNGTPQGTSSF